MKKVFLSSAFLLLLATSVNAADVETVVRTEATGKNASAKTEITNIVNGKVTKVESTGSGEIRVEVENGEVKVESDKKVLPAITTTQADKQEAEKVQEEVSQRIERVKNKIFVLFRNLFSKISGIFRFSS
ncbi:MAG TPA: hypothetical protein VMX77_02060 [Candidatus Bathyarchaeia archaeon]|nr:hypothetical protein [Candidatus Bathyarchaeia archaeon]